MNFLDKYLSEIGKDRTSYPLATNGRKTKSIERLLVVSSWNANVSIPIMLYLMLRNYKDNGDYHTDVPSDDMTKMNTVLNGLKSWILYVDSDDYFHNDDKYKKRHKELKDTMRLLGEILPSLWW